MPAAKKIHSNNNDKQSLESQANETSSITNDIRTDESKDASASNFSDKKDTESLSIQVVQGKPTEFIFSPKRSHGQAGLQMLSGGGANLVGDLKSISGLDIEIIATRNASGAVPQSQGSSSAALLVSMDPDKGREFSKQSTLANSPIWVDENHKVYSYTEGLIKEFSTPDLIFLSDGSATSIRFDIRVLGENNAILPGAMVKLYSSIQLQPILTVTNNEGIASYQIPSAIMASIAGIVIEPASMHWSKIIKYPQLKVGKSNNIRVQSYTEFNKNLLSEGLLSWGIEQLGVKKFPDVVGNGVKIAIIDSGCDVSHRMLEHIVKGVDFNIGATATSWKKDEIGHGTHVAGIIGARYSDAGGLQIRGVAPKAEIYIYKVFPQGDFFILGGAIEAAIADGVDIINMSLGSRDYSNDIAENINKAKEAGILCFVAAGNSGDAVQFPANITTAIAVSAIGSKSAIPEDSVSGNTFVPTLAGPDSFFSPSFTCFGQSIDFTAPGVGIISTYPGNGLKVLDGTSMAAPHLAGLAGLYLENDKVAASMPRSVGRADYIFNCLKRDVRQMQFATDRVGAGLPYYKATDTIMPIDSLTRIVMASTVPGGAMPYFWVGGGGGFSGGGASNGW